jgi:hypothetical protein
MSPVLAPVLFIYRGGCHWLYIELAKWLEEAM